MTQAAHIPPLTGRTAPVTNDASGEATRRQAMTVGNVIELIDRN